MNASVCNYISKMAHATCITSDFPDLQHEMFRLTLDGKLHCVPLEKSPHRVLDAGCGTGIWSIEFGILHLPLL